MTGRSGFLRGRAALRRRAALALRPRSRLRFHQDLPRRIPLEEVIVNGERLWLDPTDAVAPVTVLDRRDIERGGQSSIGKVLQALPMSTGLAAQYER